MRLREFSTILEYRRDVTANKMGAQLIAAARKDHSLDASTDWSNTAHTTDVILSKLEAMDPTRNQQYVQWLAKQYIAGQFRLEDQPAVRQTLVDYTKLKPRLNADQRDINRLDYHTTVELVDGILNPQVGLDMDDQGTFPVIADTQVLYNGPLGQLSQPQSREASCELGSGTKWCTAATKSANRYQYYADRGELYVWRDRNGEKYQLHITEPGKDMSWEFRDSRNNRIEQQKFAEFRTRHPVLRQWFRQAEQGIMKYPAAAVKYAVEEIRGRWSNAEPVIAQDARAAVDYAEKAIQGRWPEAEDTIIQDARAAVDYAEKAIQGRWPEAEDTIIENPVVAARYANKLIRGRWPEAEHSIIGDPHAAALYAFTVIRGRWPEAEDVITQDARAAMDYAVNVIQGRWSEAEDTIIQKPQIAADYAEEVIQGRWPEAESSIIKDPHAAAHYASMVLQRRWPRAEPTIIKNNWAAVDYARYAIQGRWPEAEPVIIKDARAAAIYAGKVIQGRWPDAEPVIKKDDQAYNYYRDRMEDLGDPVP